MKYKLMQGFYSMFFVLLIYDVVRQMAALEIGDSRSI